MVWLVGFRLVNYSTPTDKNDEFIDVHIRLATFDALFKNFGIKDNELTLNT
jgi:hypothetical protein